MLWFYRLIATGDQVFVNYKLTNSSGNLVGRENDCPVQFRIYTPDGNLYDEYTYNYSDNDYLTEELISALENIDENIIDLAESCYIYNNGKTTTFLKRKWFPCEKVIVMSATANAEIYRMLTHYPVYDYICKMTEYTGELRLYPNYTFSRYALLEHDGIMDYLKEQIGDDTVITFKTFEKMFNTEYHYFMCFCQK